MVLKLKPIFIGSGLFVSSQAPLISQKKHTSFGGIVRKGLITSKLKRYTYSDKGIMDC